MASMGWNIVGSSPSGAVATVSSSSIAIGSAAPPCGKQADEPDGVLRFAVSGPGSGCLT
jgi:hypothetical protein